MCVSDSSWTNISYVFLSLINFNLNWMSSFHGQTQFPRMLRPRADESCSGSQAWPPQVADGKWSVEGRMKANRQGAGPEARGGSNTLNLIPSLRANGQYWPYMDMTVCGHAPYDHIWMSCCYLHQRKSPVPQTGTTNPESVPNDSRSFTIRTLIRELVPNQSRTSRHWFRTNPEQLQDRSRSGLSRCRSG